MEKYNKESIDKLIKDLYNLTNMKVCIIDGSENELGFYPRKYGPFCELLRKNKIMDEKCKECDKKAYAYCKKNKKGYGYICHAGLYEYVSPILFNDNIVGFIVIGQIKRNICNLIIDKDYKDYDELLEKYNKLPIIDDKVFESACNVIHACTSYEYLKTIVNSFDNSIDYRINDYIINNINQPLIVDDLCFQFHISRNELYNIFNNYFNMTPAEYIKNKRIEIACNLLKENKYKISTIGEKVGINDYNYFSKVFKKIMKTSPTSYRKQFQ